MTLAVVACWINILDLDVSDVGLVESLVSRCSLAGDGHTESSTLAQARRISLSQKWRRRESGRRGSQSLSPKRRTPRAQPEASARQF